MIYLTCTQGDLAPIDCTTVRWLDRDADYSLARELWKALGHELTYLDWVEAHNLEYTYAAIVQEGKIISCAAMWRYSNEAWEVAAVVTRDGYQRRGYSKQVVAFVTWHILQNGRRATCTTQDNNFAMIATAESVGFHITP